MEAEEIATRPELRNQEKELNGAPSLIAPVGEGKFVAQGSSEPHVPLN
jgi:hypothetical protein